MKLIRNLRTTYEMYRFFKLFRKNGKHPRKAITLWKLYKVVRAR